MSASPLQTHVQVDWCSVSTIMIIIAGSTSFCRQMYTGCKTALH